MCLILNKNKINGNQTTSLESVHFLPRTPDSEASEGGNLIKEYVFYIYQYMFVYNFVF